VDTEHAEKHNGRGKLPPQDAVEEAKAQLAALGRHDPKSSVIARHPLASTGAAFLLGIATARIPMLQGVLRAGIKLGIKQAVRNYFKH